MKIQAINSAIGCQPIRQVEFARKHTAPIIIEDPVAEEDTFTPQDPYTTEAKYNFACRLAAYYKNQYQNLLTKGCCEA